MAGGGHVIRNHLFFAPQRTAISTAADKYAADKYAATDNLEDDPLFDDAERFDFAFAGGYAISDVRAPAAAGNRSCRCLPLLSFLAFIADDKRLS